MASVDSLYIGSQYVLNYGVFKFLWKFISSNIPKEMLFGRISIRIQNGEYWQNYLVNLIYILPDLSRLIYCLLCIFGIIYISINVYKKNKETRKLFLILCIIILLVLFASILLISIFSLLFLTIFCSSMIFSQEAKTLFISPNNDGIQDELIIPLSISEKRYIVEWSLIILDSEGNVVRTIGNKEKRPENITVKNFFAVKVNELNHNNTVKAFAFQFFKKLIKVENIFLSV